MNAPFGPLCLLALATLLCILPVHAHAQHQEPERVYIVARGDTLSTIAARLGVSMRALAERNHLEPPYALRVGRRLRLPDGIASSIARTLPLRNDPGSTASTARTRSSRANPTAPSRAVRRDARNEHRWGRPRTPGRVRLVREYNNETLTIDLRRISRSARRRMEYLLRSHDGRRHPIHPRLLRLLAIVSDHFGGRTIHVISGYRPYRRGQWTPHSNHNVGRAIDFRIEGVPNRVLRDFCRTLPRTGCGYYPRSVFVHMDVREESASWVDWSRPGQRPIYGREDRPPPDEPANAPTPHVASPVATPADESVDDVASDNDSVRTAPTPPEDMEDSTQERVTSTDPPSQTPTDHQDPALPASHTTAR